MTEKKTWKTPTIIVIVAVIASLCICRSDASWSDTVYTSHGNSQKKIAITFDDGPHGRLTPEILDILEEYSVKATFFVIGQNAQTHPDIIRRMAKEGHEIGNHTYSHVILKDCSIGTIDDELTQAEMVLYEIGEYRPALVRPPCGAYNKNVIDVANAHEYNIVLWSIDTRDWEHTPADNISEMIMNTIKSGDIILCHDFISGYSPTPDVLKTVIPKLLADGYTFVTVSELISAA